MQQYNHKEIEKKWSNTWYTNKIYEPDLNNAKNPYYNLMMFPYPSAEGLHVGNMYAFTGSDVFGRFMRMQGYDVFEPIGLDGFGIHSENYAIKQNIHPKQMSKKTEENFYRQLKLIGNGFAWDSKLETYNPDYYKWTQWIFLQMFKNGLAYQDVTNVNWCPSCKTVLSDEQVEQGKCERCKTEVTQKSMKQWFFRITKYAEQLIDDLDKVDWEDKIINTQKNWIGKSEGEEIDFEIDMQSLQPDRDLKNGISEYRRSTESDNIVLTSSTAPSTTTSKDNFSTGKNHELSAGATQESHSLDIKPSCNDKPHIKVFTTRPDTIEGVTFLVISPEHALVSTLLNNLEISNYVLESKNKSDQERIINKEKTGVFTGLFAINPVTQEKIPVWIADYVLATYATGAVMGVPFSDERDKQFAEKFSIEIKEHKEYTKQVGEKKITYKLRDWCISRQRYWGAPIPIIYCEKCGTVAVEEKDLPVLLPDSDDYLPSNDGKAPLARNEEFVNTKCPKCNGNAKRETDVCDTFLDSSWYYLRYPSIKPIREAKNGISEYRRSTESDNIVLTSSTALSTTTSKENSSQSIDNKLSARATQKSHSLASETPFTSLRTQLVGCGNPEMPWNTEITRKWLPVDKYIGGAEHAVLHLLYSRFVTKALRDFGYLDFDEPFINLRAHGLILKDGAKMSKSKGNVINPDEYIERFGADTLRVYLMFMGPLSQGGDFRDNAILGVNRFLNRVWKSAQIKTAETTSKELSVKLNWAIQKCTASIPKLKYNVAIASLMEFLNEWESKDFYVMSKDDTVSFLKLLAPMAPFMTEELYSIILGSSPESIHLLDWPQINKEILIQDTCEIAVQVNGVVRSTLKILKGADEEQVKVLALNNLVVIKFIGTNDIKRVIYIENKIINFVI